ncbi:pimeloyl-ACP methyl ester carboxylesterase [Bradyrhizobium sp. LM6.10]
MRGFGRPRRLWRMANPSLDEVCAIIVLFVYGLVAGRSVGPSKLGRNLLKVFIVERLEEVAGENGFSRKVASLMHQSAAGHQTMLNPGYRPLAYRATSHPTPKLVIVIAQSDRDDRESFFDATTYYGQRRRNVESRRVLPITHSIPRWRRHRADRPEAPHMALERTSSPSFLSDFQTALRRRPAVAMVAGAAALLAATALVNRYFARKAERENPPQGRFIDIDGVRLHYMERGSGRPLVLFHGNGSMIQDFQSSGLIDLAAKDYRVVAFDRPGFGHSSRPRSIVWGPDEQADLFQKALERLGIRGAIVLGHSWAASVAIALAIRHPSFVEALVLASGYYFPNPRVDLATPSVPAVPGLGDIVSNTISPLVARLMWPGLMRKIFGPQSVPEKFAGFPVEMAVRPSQLRASAEEAAMMVPIALAASKTYSELTVPTVIIAGEDDRLIEFEQSARLRDKVEQSRLRRIAGAGHMIQQSATSDLMAAIEEAASMSAKGERDPAHVDR